MVIKDINVNEEQNAETIYRYENFINPALTRLFKFMGLGKVEKEAQGAVIKDLDGHEYIDFLGGYGVFNLGHRHPKIIKAVQEELANMPLSSKVLFDQKTAELAYLLAEITPGDLQYTFFCNSGTEAVEGALKLARLATGKSGIIATINGFHGKTLGALSATGRDVFRQPCEPLMPNFSHVPFGDAQAALNVINENTAAIIVEPIQGEGGIVVPPDDYLTNLRQICDQHKILLIFDEVQTGMGRTGKMFAAEHYQVVPDILTVAKALGGGVMPIGAFISRPQVFEVLINSPFLHTSTFGGNPLACAAGVATIKTLKQERLIKAAADKGKYVLERLKKIQKKYPDVIAEVRGKGLLLGIELTREGAGGFLMAELINHGFIVAYTLNNPKVIRIEPPLNIAEQYLDKFLIVLDKVIAAANVIIKDL